MFLIISAIRVYCLLVHENAKIFLKVSTKGTLNNQEMIAELQSYFFRRSSPCHWFRVCFINSNKNTTCGCNSVVGSRKFNPTFIKANNILFENFAKVSKKKKHFFKSSTCCLNYVEPHLPHDQYFLKRFGTE